MKKNKNAFTLIELLAVIVILAVIALIATPIILGIVEDAKKDAFLRSVELLVSTTDIDIENKIFEEEYAYTITDGNISNMELEIKNTTGMNGTIIYDIEGKEAYAIHNATYCVKKTSDMNKAEISEYIEGKCSPFTIYKNGQRVYFDVDKGIGCTKEEYEKSYDNSLEDYTNSLTGYNGLNGEGNQNSCLLFYAFNDEDDETINLILDHNTTGTTYWTDIGTTSNANGPITVLSELITATNLWKGTITPENYTVTQTGYGNYTIPYNTENYKARLITAQEVAKITGADIKEGLMFNEMTTSTSAKFCLDNLTQSCEYMGTYGWLYDRTNTDCEDYGCFNNSDSEMNGSGYWTGTATYGDLFRAWFVIFTEQLGINIIMDNRYTGVRPVIEVLKSKVTPGEAPVIPAS